jgi:hypothetical protein
MSVFPPKATTRIDPGFRTGRFGPEVFLLTSAANGVSMLPLFQTPAPLNG